MYLARGNLWREIGKKKVDFFSSFFSGWVDVHHEASASSSTTTAPRVRVIVTLSISLSRVGFLVVIIVSTLFLFFSTYIQKLFCL